MLPNRHPEMVPYHDAVAAALLHPHVVVRVQEPTPVHRHYYQQGVLSGRLRSLWLRVIVRFPEDDRNGFIVTAYAARTIDDAGGEFECLTR